MAGTLEDMDFPRSLPLGTMGREGPITIVEQASSRPISQTGWKPGFSPVSKMILETGEEFSEGSPGSCPMDGG